MSNPPPQGRPRPILDSGSPRRTMVLRPPGSAHISLTARRAQRCRTATHPADHTPAPSANAPNPAALVDKRLSISAEQRAYVRVFLAAHGPFPHPCHFCGEPVEAVRGRGGAALPVVHHLDRDHANSDQSNLVPAHRGCHTRSHAARNRPRRGWPGERGAVAGSPARARPQEAPGNTASPAGGEAARRTAPRSCPSPGARSRPASTRRLGGSCRRRCATRRGTAALRGVLG